MAKSQKESAPTPDQAEEAVRQAQADLQAAAEAAASAGATLVALKTRGVPRMEVEVLPGNAISHEGETYYGEGYTFAPEGHTGNDTLVVDGPTAIGLMQLGHVQVKARVEDE